VPAPALWHGDELAGAWLPRLARRCRSIVGRPPGARPCRSWG